VVQPGLLGIESVVRRDIPPHPVSLASITGAIAYTADVPCREIEEKTISEPSEQPKESRMRSKVFAIAALFVLAAALPAAAQTTVFINEIHYDNASTDVGEAVEIAGPAGTDLTGWSVVLYNGNGGASYNSTALSGTIPNICGGFGVIDLTYPTNGIQNGAPDGLALVDNGGTAVQFLSYEGTFVATGGPAAGQTSTDIGVSEASSTPVGDSLQLAGTGTIYEDFAWQPASPSSFGGCNPGQIFASGHADPVINEFVLNHIGSDISEFIEVWGDPFADYSTMAILEIEGDSTAPGTVDGVFPVGTTNGGGLWFPGFFANEFENGTLTLLMVKDFSGGLGDDLDTDDDGTLDVTPWSRVVDDVAVTDGGASDQTYAAVVLAPGFDGVPFTVGGASRIPNGTDTDTTGDWLRNDFSGEGLPGFIGTPEVGEAFNTPDAVNQEVIVAAALVVNEIDYDQSGTDAAEFIELKNTSAADLDLAAYDLVLVNGTGGGATIYNTITLPAVTLAPGDYFVVCGDAANVFGCDLDVSPNTNLIQNGAPDAVAVMEGALVIDTVSYEGDTAPPYTEGSGSGLVDNSSIDFLGISRWPDGADTGQNNVDLSPRCISPGAPNIAGATGCFEPAPPALVINEIDYDQPGSDTGEFVEIKNAGSSPVDLGSFVLELVNGNGASIYKTIALPAISLAPGDYFVVCGNPANVANCDLDATPDSNLIQNGAPDAVALTRAGLVIDTVSYEGDTDPPYTEGSGAGLVDTGWTGFDFMGISRLPDGFDSDQNNSDLRFVCITPGTANTSVDFGCGPTGAVLEIFEIQGSGTLSPFVDAPLSTNDNIVTAVRDNGFFIQTPEIRSDGDPTTSDGIFVFTNSPPGVAVGDQVDVGGTVAEFFDFTEIGGVVTVTVDAAGHPLPAPQPLDETMPSGLPSDPPELERYEGMLVAAAGVATGPTDRFGDTPVVARDQRSFREPGIEWPGLSGLPVWDGNPEVFEIDPDGLVGMTDEVLFTLQEFSAVGALGFSFGDYQILPSSLTIGPPAAVLRPVRAPEFGEFTLASQNLERLSDLDPNFAIRVDKVSRHIREVLGSPDILAVQEVDTIGTLQAVADTIAADEPGLVYTPYLMEGNDPSGIDVGYLVRDTIFVRDVYQYGADFEFLFNGNLRTTYDRPPLVLDADYVGAGEPFPITVIVNHLRSLGGIEDDDSIARGKRSEQALQLSYLVQTLQVSNPDMSLVLTGDFNAFQFTDGYVDVMGQITGNLDPLGALIPGTDEVDPDLFNEVFALPQAERYSFVFSGDAQCFDYMLTSHSVEKAVRDVEYSRGNADSPAALFLDDSTSMRVADHDGVVLYLLADSDFDGFPNQIDVCSGTTIPESVPTVRLGTNRWALVDDDGIFDTTPSGGQGGGQDRAFTIEETAGCSCEQIIDELHLGGGHVKFGCSIGAMETWIQQVQP